MADIANYLNVEKPCTLFKSVFSTPYFVDKSLMLEELASCKHICVTRPRRFGKSVMATMIASYFGKGIDSSDVFSKLKICKSKVLKQPLNSENVIFITLNQFPRNCQTYKQYIDSINDNLLSDLREAYPDVERKTNDPIVLLEEIHGVTGESFMFVLDEWDFIFDASFAKPQDKKDYLDFLRNLLKDRSYVSMAYMTGILPITKYSSGSDLNMFSEYTFASSKFSEYFGFSESEVDDLFKCYMAKTTKPKKVTREGLKNWYSGYFLPNGEKIYNPFSIVSALDGNQVGSYWTNTGPRDEIFFCLEKYGSDMRRDLALLISSEPVYVKFTANAISPSATFDSKDETLSAMALYGLLTINDSIASIPNLEIMEKFISLLYKKSSLGYLHSLASQSLLMFSSTLEMDIYEVTRILDEQDEFEPPVFTYGNEYDLSAIVNIAYLSARESYDIVRDNKDGKDHVIFLFFPYVRTDECIILAMEYDSDPDDLIEKIKENKYPQAFKGTSWPYTGKLLLVGISCSRDLKYFSSAIEMRESF
ncbi:MAG: AAA family ATPase [Clostridiales bacterium]|nr:AAA family ATPase [Clostridiales bacterium]